MDERLHQNSRLQVRGVASLWTNYDSHRWERASLKCSIEAFLVKFHVCKYGLCCPSVIAMGLILGCDHACVRYPLLYIQLRAPLAFKRNSFV